MRILTVTNLYPPDVIGGYEMGCEQMVQALRQRGHDVLVLTSCPRQPVATQAGVERSLRLTHGHLHQRQAPTPPHIERIMDVQGNVVESANVAAMLRALAVFQPEVVYLWNTAFIGGLGLAGALAHLQTPVVWHLMDAVPRSAVTVGERLASSAARAVSRRMRARYLVCSQRLLKEIAAAGFEFGDRVTLVPNWVEPFPSPRERSWYPHAAAKLRMVTAGQLAPHKGVDLIIEAASRLLDAGHSAYQIDLFGSGMVDRYRRLILEHGLQNHVRLAGVLPQRELVDRYWGYDVFLFPTWIREPFGFAPLEAAARGCVPIVSRDCGYAEWFVDGAHCLKVAPSVDALAAAVRSILDGTAQLESLARRARWVIGEAFALEGVAACVEQAMMQAREAQTIRPGESDDAYHLARLAERMALDWAEQSPLT